eukprot:jgi/Tetstr1/431480/TSEL_002132.t1
MDFFRRVFKEPVVQFLCVGGVLFGAYVFFAEPEETPRETILISQARVQSLADFFQTLRNRAPTAEEMDGLIDDYVAEEVLYREAIKLGLDKDDLVVRRRMRQKLELMLVDMTRGVQPDEERLKDFFDANRDNYGFLDVAGTYLVLGVEHILLGIDHLLFVLALLLLVDGRRRLVETVTAFTLAHSITLTGATLGLISAPPRLVEVLIALSIVFVAGEVIHRLRGQNTLTVRKPWLIAFLFGLLHGFGFAGALREIGIPENAVPSALLFFNVGVELGQLLFIGFIIIAINAFLRIYRPQTSHARFVAAWSIGIVAAFWTLERMVAIWPLPFV